MSLEMLLKRTHNPSIDVSKISQMSMKYLIFFLLSHKSSFFFLYFLFSRRPVMHLEIKFIRRDVITRNMCKFIMHNAR
jgi:hypothetical protein